MEWIGEQRRQFAEAHVQRVAGRVRTRAPRIELLDGGREEQLVALPKSLRHRSEAGNKNERRA